MSHHDAAAQAADTYRAEMECAASDERMAREARREVREARGEAREKARKARGEARERAREKGRGKAGEGRSTAPPRPAGRDTGATHTLTV